MSNTCSMEGCNRPIYRRTYCSAHYRTGLRNRTIVSSKPERCCSVDGCNKRHASLGYCHRHIAQYKKYGCIANTKYGSKEIYRKEVDKSNWTEENIAYVAGLIEGERISCKDFEEEK